MEFTKPEPVAVELAADPGMPEHNVSTTTAALSLGDLTQRRSRPIAGTAVRLSTQLPRLPPATEQTQWHSAPLNQTQAGMT